jgi:hypothetical protein
MTLFAAELGQSQGFFPRMNWRLLGEAWKAGQADVLWQIIARDQDANATMHNEASHTHEYRFRLQELGLVLPRPPQLPVIMTRAYEPETSSLFPVSSRLETARSSTRAGSAQN